VGFQRILSILNFIVKTNFAIYPILQYPKTHYSAKASLRAQYSAKASLRAQHSTIPIGAKPLTCVSVPFISAAMGAAGLTGLQQAFSLYLN
jgi:hypothetical protein